MTASILSVLLVMGLFEALLKIYLSVFAELVALSRTQFVPRISAFLSFLIGTMYMYPFYFLEEVVFLQKALCFNMNGYDDATFPVKYKVLVF